MNKLLLAAALLLVSCATLPIEPSRDNQRLVIGKFTLQAANFAYFGPATVNGTHTAGIQVKVRDLSNGQVKVIGTNALGLFTFVPVEDHRYQVTELRFRKTVGDAWSELYATPDRLTIDPASEGVSELPALLWEADDKTKTYAAMRAQPDDLKEVVTEAYPKSGWLSMEWNAVPWR